MEKEKLDLDFMTEALQRPLSTDELVSTIVAFSPGNNIKSESKRSNNTKKNKGNREKKKERMREREQ